MAPAPAVVDGHVADTHRLDRYLPEAALRMIDGEPVERPSEAGEVVAPEVDLARVRAEGNAKLRHHAGRALERAAEEAAYRRRREARQTEAHDAVAGHGAERPILQARGGEHDHVQARLAVSPGAHADSVTHQHSPGLAFPQVGLGEGHREAVAGAVALGEAPARLDGRAAEAHIHGSRGAPGRIAAVLHAGGALAGTVRQQDMAGGGVEDDLQGLRGVANGHVPDVEACFCSPAATGWQPAERHGDGPPQRRGHGQRRGARGTRAAQRGREVGPHRQRRQRSEAQSWHGALGSSDWAAPVCARECDVNARLSFTSIKAHEYEDCSEVLRAKAAVLAGLVRKAQQCVALTGAGISTAAGIDDYATKARETSVTSAARPQVRDWKEARPTKAHRVLTAMYEAGLLKHWVQQNHDSLPQKAGYPQHALNEIHGSLHDPANPIVPYEGVLRDDLDAWVQRWKSVNDLCLALGTSLSGFNVDSMVDSAAQAYRRGSGFGVVIVNLQQTPYDDLCTLRIFARIDALMEVLADELGIADKVRPMDHVYVPDLAQGAVVAEDMFLVPFDEHGDPSPEKMVWDLRLGKRVRLTGGPYAGDVGTIMEKSQSGHYRIRFEDSVNPDFNVKRRPFSLWLGNWWLEEATKGYGICPEGKIPLVNVADESPQASVAPPAHQPDAPPKARPVRPPGTAPPPPPPAAKGKGKAQEASGTGPAAAAPPLP